MKPQSRCNRSSVLLLVLKVLLGACSLELTGARGKHGEGTPELTIPALSVAVDCGVWLRFSDLN